MKKSFQWTGILLLVISWQAHAKGGKAGQHMVEVAGGVAMPSFYTAPFHNPAGMIYNMAFSLDTRIAMNTGGGNSVTPGAGILVGNGSYGIAAGADYATGPGSLSFTYGGAGYIDGLKTAFGVGANTSTSGGTDFNLGALIMPYESVRIGAGAFGITGGVSGFGAGVAWDAGEHIAVVGDMGFGGNSNNLSVKPGILVHGPQFAVSFGYGFGLGGSFSSSFMQRGPSVGLGINIGNSMLFHFYWDQISDIYAGLNIRM